MLNDCNLAKLYSFGIRPMREWDDERQNIQSRVNIMDSAIWNNVYHRGLLYGHRPKISDSFFHCSRWELCSSAAFFP